MGFQFTRDMEDEICKLIASGISVAKIGKMDGMPSAWLIHDHVLKDEDFRKRYACAREAQAEFYANEIVDIADQASKDIEIDADGKPYIDGFAVQRARVMIDARKWYASKVAPKKYGDKLELSGNSESPLTIQIHESAKEV